MGKELISRAQKRHQKNSQASDQKGKNRHQGINTIQVAPKKI